jgi:hypothetical protein
MAAMQFIASAPPPGSTLARAFGARPPFRSRPASARGPARVGPGSGEQLIGHWQGCRRLARVPSRRDSCSELGGPGLGFGTRDSEPGGNPAASGYNWPDGELEALKPGCSLRRPLPGRGRQTRICGRWAPDSQRRLRWNGSGTAKEYVTAPAGKLHSSPPAARSLQ